ncbi:MAG: peptidoglycan DD-metalloendopeptidase family protein [Weeksellaceae bacterium]
MKTKQLYLLVIFLLTPFFFNTFAQSPPGQATLGYFNLEVEEGQQCLTDAQRADINAMLDANIQMLKDEGRLLYNEASKPDLVQFGWPVKTADDVNYNQIWGTSNYVDHQSGSGLLDYFCQQKTYNGHKGTDIYLWPFWWYAMDHFQGENIAAADGQIILKQDGNYDRRCAMGAYVWNAIYVQHADGSVAWYGHMKEGSLTSKGVGDTVVRGEFLGNVGSSGSSTGPHLHFEVYAANAALIDPFAGECNSRNDESWWDEQMSHDVPKLNAVLTHSAPPVFPECPQQETPNLKDYFEVGEVPLLAVYLTDQQPGSVLNLKVIRPDGSNQYDWDLELTDYYQLSYWYWSLTPDMTGNWKWQVTYQGETVTHDYFVGTMGTAESEVKNLQVFPNPANDFINLQSTEKIVKAQIFDTQGRLINNISNASGIERMNIKSLPAGVYILNVIDGKKNTSTVKFVKK